MRGAALAVALAACGGVAPAQTNVPATKESAGAFDTVYRVLQHPRCRNCHIPGDAPLIGDEGASHHQNVIRGPDGEGAPGMGCITCHGAANPPESYGPRAPPGAPRWHLPPPAHKMVFIDRPIAEVCRTLVDTAENGGKDMAALLEHMRSDPLVLWGWSPGSGRAPVPIPHDEVVAKFKAWADAGAPCPGG